MSLPARLGWGLALLAALAVLVPVLVVLAWVRVEQQDRRAEAQLNLQNDLVSQRTAWERRLEEESDLLVRRLDETGPEAGELAALSAWTRSGRCIRFEEVK